MVVPEWKKTKELGSFETLENSKVVLTKLSRPGDVISSTFASAYFLTNSNFKKEELETENKGKDLYKLVDLIHTYWAMVQENLSLLYHMLHILRVLEGTW